jgi:hypothetical protein
MPRGLCTSCFRAIGRRSSPLPRPPCSPALSRWCSPGAGARVGELAGWIIAWVALLAVASAVTGRAGLATVLTAAFLLQVIPSLATAYRTARPSGISAGTWLLILGELSCWTIFGLHQQDPRLITLGLTGVTASILILARLSYANRLHAPVAVRQA